MPSSQILPIERKLVLLLKEERQKQGVSANQLAAKIGIDRSTITRLESDIARPTLWVLIEICRGLGLRLSDVLRRAEDSEGERVKESTTRHPPEGQRGKVST